MRSLGRSRVYRDYRGNDPTGARSTDRFSRDDYDKHEAREILERPQGGESTNAVQLTWALLGPRQGEVIRLALLVTKAAVRAGKRIACVRRLESVAWQHEVFLLQASKGTTRLWLQRNRQRRNKEKHSCACRSEANGEKTQLHHGGHPVNSVMRRWGSEATIRFGLVWFGLVWFTTKSWRWTDVSGLSIGRASLVGNLREGGGGGWGVTISY